MIPRRELEKVLKKEGFVLQRINKHMIYKNKHGKMIVLPRGRMINRITAQVLLKRIKEK